MDSQIVVFGMRFETKTFATDREANRFMSVNHDYGVIAVLESGVIHCAKIDDDGESE